MRNVFGGRGMVQWGAAREKLGAIGCWAAGMIALGTLAGCGQHVPHANKPRGDVVVKLTYGGEPITAGDVDLSNLQTGEGGGGALDHTGTARIPGVVLGDYIVTFLPPLSSPIPGEASPVVKLAKIDRKFQSPEKSPLKLSVPKEGKEVSFDLKLASTTGERAR